MQLEVDSAEIKKMTKNCIDVLIIIVIESTFDKKETCSVNN